MKHQRGPLVGIQGAAAPSSGALPAAACPRWFSSSSGGDSNNNGDPQQQGERPVIPGAHLYGSLAEAGQRSRVAYRDATAWQPADNGTTEQLQSAGKRVCARVETREKAELLGTSLVCTGQNSLLLLFLLFRLTLPS